MDAQSPRWRRGPLLLVAFAAGLALAAILAYPVAGRLAAARLRAAASERGLTASWRGLAVGFPFQLRVADLAFASGTDTVLHVVSARAGLAPWSALFGGSPLSSLSANGIRANLRSSAGADPDTVEPAEASLQSDGPAAPRWQRGADALVRMLLVPASRLPRIEIQDVVVNTAGDDSLGGQVSIRRLANTPGPGGVRLEASGSTGSTPPLPFEIDLRYGSNDRLTGSATFAMLSAGRKPERLPFQVDAAVHQDRPAETIRVGADSRVWIGGLPVVVSGTLQRHGPRFELGFSADSLNTERVRRVPEALLGPLAEIHATGSFDWRLRVVIDLGQPDSSDVRGQVTGHGLSIDPARTRLRLHGLEGPFVATIHLPRGRLVTRAVGPANPHFRPLAAIDSNLVRAVISNEDGSFFRHQGFNNEAVRLAIAANLRAGAYRRGAGTITMQLARNLYLGHDRRLPRKLQEAVLAWILEHLVWASKERLLEIYLNIIEWGPDVHGANEAARYYFDRDAGRVTIPEALFLATVVPSPNRWRQRFDATGALRPFARAQMHFIGRAMVRRGWLSSDLLPPADSMQVTLAGKARKALFPPRDSTAADSTRASAT